MESPDDSAWDELVEAFTASPGGDHQDLTWVTLPEAAAAAGVSRSTLRSWYRSRQIPSRLQPGGHGPQRYVPRELVMERALRGRGRLGTGPPEVDSAPSRSAVEIVMADAAAREQRLMAIIAEQEAEIRELLARAVSAETELRGRRRT